MLETFANILGMESVYWTRFVLTLALMVLSGAFFIYIRGRLRPLVRKALFALYFLYLIRMLILGNPLAWDFYNSYTDAELVGHRQISLINVQTKELQREFKAPPLDILMMGSSQINAIFNNMDYTKFNITVNFLIINGFKPADFMLFSDYALARKPTTIMIYLSQFDLGSVPHNVYELTPAQGSFLFEFARKSKLDPVSGRLEKSVRLLSIGELLPEFKYSFVFKGIVGKALGGEAARIASPMHQLNSKRRAPKVGPFEERIVDFNMIFVEDFVKLCAERGVKVLIVEGSINPRSQMPNWNRVERHVKKRLSALAKNYENARFIPSERQYRLKAHEFLDNVHAANHGASTYKAYLFGDHIFPYLKELDPGRKITMPGID